MSERSVKKLMGLFGLINLLLIGWGMARGRQSGELRVTFLDVGQGDAAIIESPSGKTLVVDAGGLLPAGDDEGRRVVAPYLRYRGINHIDMLLLTHPHADHIGGAATLIDRFPVSLLLDNGAPSVSPALTHLLTEAHTHHVPSQRAHQGQILDFGDGVVARVLAPNASSPTGPENEACVVLRVEYGRTAFLLDADAEADEEAAMTRSGQPLNCDVLKVGHHGSHTSTTPGFLAAAHPRLAIISVGAHNLYGHPSPEVLERLQDEGARIYRTDKNGAVTCLSDGVTVRAETMQPGN